MAASVGVVLRLRSRREGVTCAVRYDLANGREREVVAGNKRLVGHDAVEQFAPRRFGHPNAATAHAAVNRALRRIRSNIAISLLCLRGRTLRSAGRSRRLV